jgi:hypothetical protein
MFLSLVRDFVALSQHDHFIDILAQHLHIGSRRTSREDYIQYKASANKDYIKLGDVHRFSLMYTFIESGGINQISRWQMIKKALLI